jgi:sugar phosphate isomerase/epimerase
MEKLLCRTPDELFGMADAVGRENMGTTFDAGHANTTKNIPAYLKHKARITHMHIHDNQGSADQHLEIGKGTIDWEYLLRELKGFEGVMVIEGRSIEEGKGSLEYVKKRQ